MPVNIVVSGVGGQGILSLSQVLGESAIKSGVKALIAETHGLSQRGGSIIVHLRIGNDVMSPLIPEGNAHILLGLELLEAARYAHYLLNNSLIVVNDKIIRPNVPGVETPKRGRIINYLKERSRHLFLVKASDIAVRHGNPIGANMVMLGYISNVLSRLGLLKYEYAEESASAIGGKRYGELNKQLFRIGFNEANRAVSDLTIAEIKKLFS
jgi:indolepyruvate ferredoxin oxidoreductase beta subunit